MDYLKIYNSLISRAQGRIKKRKGSAGYVYYESHHIVPRCLGGSNDKSNLVLLTAEEHWVSHLLLVKIYPGVPKLVYACQAMSMAGGNNQRTTNKLFGWIRRAYSDEMSKKQKGKAVPPEVREKISQTLKGRPNIRQQGNGNVSKRPEVAAKISKSKQGLSWGNHSEDSKKQISLSNMGRKGLDADSNPSYKGTVIATPINGGPEIRMDGRKQVEAAGFNYQMVRKQVRGIGKTYKGYTFRQESS